MQDFDASAINLPFVIYLTQIDFGSNYKTKRVETEERWAVFVFSAPKALASDLQSLSQQELKRPPKAGQCPGKVRLRPCFVGFCPSLS